MSLRDDLAAAEARADAIRRKIAAETSCAVRGHRWKHIGGMNACCDWGGGGCHCSIPVHECTDCGDCDYGENAEADDIKRQCAEQGDPKP